MKGNTPRQSISFSEGETYDVYAFVHPEDPDIVPTVFRWCSPCHTAYVCGSFDNWGKRIPLVVSANEYMAIVYLKPGRYEYKYLIDEEWRFDENHETVKDNYNGLNNVVNVSLTDKDFMQSLLLDSREVVTDHVNLDTNLFEQKLHPFLMYKSVHEVMMYEKMFHDSNPPNLPPLSTKSILNNTLDAKDPSGEPLDLPEPDIVTVNHVYCMGKRDSALPTSVTNRYRDKFYTTVYFKSVIN